MIDDWKAKIAALVDGPHAHEHRSRVSDNPRSYFEPHYTIEASVNTLDIQLARNIMMPLPRLCLREI